jgi:hypothetical protein
LREPERMGATGSCQRNATAERSACTLGPIRLALGARCWTFLGIVRLPNIK